MRKRLHKQLHLWRTVVPLALLGLAACDKPRAVGEAMQILVVAPDQVWNGLESEIQEALVPRTFTVRDERVFDIAHLDPSRSGWGNLRVQRQILVIGDADDPAVAEAIGAHRGSVPPAPAVFQVHNLWARGQLVTVLLLTDDSRLQEALPLLRPLGATYLAQFEEYARSRMFVTGVNEELRDSLVRNGGFSLTLPRVYRAETPEPGVFLFRNDQPDPSRLIRNITVTSWPAGEVVASAENAVRWRAELAERWTQPPQVTESTVEEQELEVAGRPAIQVQGVWSNPPDQWPAAGPFVTRLVECPERLFLLDAWLYAPGIPKYEYMYQLKTILDSFECAGVR